MTIAAKYALLEPVLDERTLRLWAAAEALALGVHGIRDVCRATGLNRKTVASGRQELRADGAATVVQPRPEHSGAPAPGAVAPGHIRRPGGGRKPLTVQDPTLRPDLEALVEPVTRGDPQSPLRWTCKSLSQLRRELLAAGHTVSEETVRHLLQDVGYHLQANRKTREGSGHPDRNAQFEYLNAQVQRFAEQGQPAISVDCKKKELVGDFKQAGREWRPAGEPEAVRVYDFEDKALGKAIPYGVYDIAANQGWVSVGTDHDTAAFAVATIGSWWRQMGAARYPQATQLLITADGGGSNGSRTRLWKRALQELADATGLAVQVCHLPPGTSKWNKIEHRMFCHITQNWRGRPLISQEVVVQLIGSTRTQQGLEIQAALDPQPYATGIKVSAQELAQVHLEPAAFHGEWNYTIHPKPRK